MVIGTGQVGLNVGTMATIFSLNAIAGIPAARWPWSRGKPGLWIAVIGLCSLGVTQTTKAPIFAVTLIAWGFCFWMATTGAFAVLAERSVNPADRAGDAQAVMAIGRALGPLLGASLIEGSGITVLGLVGGALIFAAGLVVYVIETTVAPRDEVPAPS